MISCTEIKYFSIKDESVEKYQEINNVDINENILNFNMTDEEIKAYYETIDNLVDKEPGKTIYLGIVDLETKEKIDAERSKENKYFEEDVEFIYNTRHVWSRTPVKPDGYVGFNNYWYREIENRYYQPDRNYIQYAEENVNPLKCYPGYIITEKDIPVYESTFYGEIPNRQFIGWKEVGLLKSGTVIRLDGVPIDNYIFVVRDFNLQGYIKSTDIELIERLQNAVSYKIENEKLYRLIEGQKIEIHIDRSGYYENGNRFIRNAFNNNLLDKFYFWEILGDYLFDENGNLIDIVEYGPGWTGE
jgi:hypothetical protein